MAKTRQTAEKYRVVQSAEFRAAAAARSALIQNSEPRSGWRPPQNTDLNLAIVDWDCREARDKDTKKLKGHDWCIRYAVVAPGDPDLDGKTYPEWFRIRPASKKEQDRSVPASQIREVIESCFEDGTKADDESGWAELLDAIIQARPPIVLRGRYKVSTRQYQGRTFEDEHTRIFGESDVSNYSAAAAEKPSGDVPEGDSIPADDDDQPDDQDASPEPEPEPPAAPPAPRARPRVRAPR